MPPRYSKPDELKESRMTLCNQMKPTAKKIFKVKKRYFTNYKNSNALKRSSETIEDERTFKNKNQRISKKY